MESIRVILMNAFRGKRFRERLKITDIQKYWKDLVGEAINNNAQPIELSHGILKVKVSSSIWMQQLHFMKDMIKDGLNKMLKRDIIVDIRLELGTFSPEKKAKKPVKPPWGEIEIRRDIKGSLGKEMRKIKDKDLRRLFRSIMARQRQLNTYRKLSSPKYTPH